jgi:hypothetical protein
LLRFRLLVSSLPSYSSSQPATLHILPCPKHAKQCGWNVNSPLCVSTIVNCRPRGRIGGMGLAARTTAVLISSAGACWSPRCEVSPKRVSMACLVCGTGKSPLRRNLRTRILISAVLVY